PDIEEFTDIEDSPATDMPERASELAHDSDYGLDRQPGRVALASAVPRERDGRLFLQKPKRREVEEMTNLAGAALGDGELTLGIARTLLFQVQAHGFFERPGTLKLHRRPDESSDRRGACRPHELRHSREHLVLFDLFGELRVHRGEALRLTLD